MVMGVDGLEGVFEVVNVVYDLILFLVFVVYGDLMVYVLFEWVERDKGIV